MKTNIKYLDEYTDEVSEYIGKVIIEVFHGIAKNIGVKNPDKFLRNKPVIQKAFEGVYFNPQKKHKYLYRSPYKPCNYYRYQKILFFHSHQPCIHMGKIRGRHADQ